jgi:hypothetical protein
VSLARAQSLDKAKTKSAESVICRKEKKLETKSTKKPKKDNILKKNFGFSKNTCLNAV